MAAYIDVVPYLTTAWNSSSIIIPVMYRDILDGVHDPRDFLSQPYTEGITDWQYNWVEYGRNLQCYYTCSFPQNTAANYVDRSITFHFLSASIEDTEEVTIRQTAKPGVSDRKIFVSGSPVSIANSDTQVTFVVNYSGSIPNWTVDTPGKGGRIDGITDVGRKTVGNDLYVTYSVHLPALGYPAMTQSNAFFQMHSGSGDDIVYANGRGEIRQLGMGQVVGTMSLGPANPKIVPWNTVQGTFWVTMSKYGSGNYHWLPPVNEAGDITIVTADSASIADSMVIEYVMDFPMNLTETPVTRSITFRMTGSTSGDYQEITGYIYQGVWPGYGSITVHGSPVTIGPDDVPEAYFEVTYSKCANYNISVCRVTHQDMRVTSGSVIVVPNGTDEDWIIPYTASFPVNLSQEPITRRVMFQMTSGSGQDAHIATGEGIIYQEGAPSPLDLGSITLDPSWVRVNASDTQTYFDVTYSKGDIDYTINPLTYTPGVTPYLVSSRVDGTNYYYRYRVEFPANTSDQQVNRTVYTRMNSGSYVKLENFYIYQAAASVTKELYIEPTVADLTAGQTQATVTAYYYGFTDPSVIPTPTTSVEGWSMVSASVNVVAGSRVEVVWRAVGVPNTGHQVKSIAFQISAPDVISRNFTIYQRGTTTPEVIKSIVLSESSKTLGASETETTVVATYKNITNFEDISTPTINLSGWSVALQDSNQVGNDLSILWRISGTANTGTSTKQGTVTFTATGVDSPVYFTLRQVAPGQGGSVDSSSFLAWKDTNTEIPGGHYIVTAEDLWRKEASTQVTTGSDPFLREHLYAAPGESSIKVNLNRVVEGLVEPRELKVLTANNLSEEDGNACRSGSEGRYDYVRGFWWYPPTETLKAFEYCTQITEPLKVQVNYEGIGVEGFGEIVTVEDNWTFQEGEVGKKVVYMGGTTSGSLLSRFPQNKAVPGQWIPFSIKVNNPALLSTVSNPNVAVGWSGNNYGWQYPIGVAGVSNRNTYFRYHNKNFKISPFNYWDMFIRYQFDKHPQNPGIGPCVLATLYHLPGGPGTDPQPFFEQKEWSRGKYVIYYYNTLGGYDYLVVEGPVVPSTQNVSNHYLTYSRKRKVYQTDQTKKFTVQMGTMPDESSVFVEEMVTSPRVYLHDIAKDEIIPVRPTTSTVEKKTFWNQGRKFANYQIELEDLTAYLRR